MISILIPFRNEVESISKYSDDLFPVVHAVMMSFKQEYEYVFVDDGSTDGSYDEVLNSIEKARITSKLVKTINITQSTNKPGLGNALRYGFTKCNGDYIVVLDADLSYKPIDILRMMITLRDNPDVKCISTSPYQEGFDSDIEGSSPMRIFGSVAFNAVYSLLLDHEISCVTGMFRMYHAQTLKKFNLKSIGYDINSEIITEFLLRKERVVEIPATLYIRTLGKSKMKILVELIREIKLIGKIIIRLITNK